MAMSLFALLVALAPIVAQAALAERQ